MPTLEQLLQKRTRDQILQLLINILQARGYSPTDWEPGSVQRTILEAVAAGIADLEDLRVKIAGSGFLEHAEGEWLDIVAKNMYGLTRKPAEFTRHIIRLRAAEGFGPYQITPGQLWVSTRDGLRFSNVAGGVLPYGGELELEFISESAGGKYNVPIGAIDRLLTPLPGVSVSNIRLIGAGADAETDESLRFRCRLRWASLGTGATADAYRFWALSAHSSVSKVRVLDQHPRGQGTVDVVVWGDGGLDPDAAAAVNDYIQARKPLTVDVAVYPAIETQIDVVATITLRAGFGDVTRSEVAGRLAEFQRALPIGGKIYRSALIEALFGKYVINVELTSPSVDVQLSEAQAAVFSTNLTYVEE